MNTYRIRSGGAVDYVMATCYSSACLSAQQIFKTDDVEVQLATQEEVNSLMWSHSYPEEDSD